MLLNQKLSARVLIKNFVKGRVSQSQLDRLLLTLPQLYPLLRYESQLSGDQIAVLRGILEKGVPGNIIECGVYRGGTTALMGLYLKEHRIPKKIYALDSFSGFKRDGIEEEVRRGLVVAQGLSAFTANSAEYVQRKIEKLGLRDMIEIVPGYFEESLDKIRDFFSLALIDCDLEKSTEFCLTTLWDRVVQGGCIIVDDYANPGYPGARIAADRFLKHVVCKQKQVQHNFLVIEK
ncbi:MAG: class I SAM-dependent methyltransferase [Deltaproteobacteria bacterium]|nr:class I SAM-dependent methyltransferase [Deltaproteobacteria bacterium]